MRLESLRTYGALVDGHRHEERQDGAGEREADIRKELSGVVVGRPVQNAGPRVTRLQLCENQAARSSAVMPTAARFESQGASNPRAEVPRREVDGVDRAKQEASHFAD
eukprot:5075361-Prymnesium_polylepis.4